MQSGFAICAFLFPNLKSIFLSTLANANLIRDEAYYSAVYIYRLFGYSDGLTYGMPVLQAFLAMISLFFGIRYNMKYFVFFPFLAFSAVINARTSFVVFALCGMCLFFVLMDRKIRIFNFAALCLFVFLVLFLGSAILPVFEFINQNTLNWIGRGVTEIYDLLLKGDMERGYFSYLFDEKRWMFPEGISFVFGE